MTDITAGHRPGPEWDVQFVPEDEPARCWRWMPSETFLLGAAFTAILVAVGLQIAELHGVDVGLPDWAINVIVYSDVVLGVVAVGSRYKSETHRMRTESTLQSDMQAELHALPTLRRETWAYLASLALLLTAIGLQLGSQLGSTAPGLDEAGVALQTLGTVGGAVAFAQEYRRTQQEEEREARRSGALADHRCSHLRAAVSVLSCLAALSILGVQIATMMNGSVSRADLTVALLTGTSAMINMVGLALSYIAEQAAKRQRHDLQMVPLTESLEESGGPQFMRMPDEGSATPSRQRGGTPPRISPPRTPP